MNHITIVAGARPNFIKIAPIIHEINRRKSNGININFSLVHTGQHYDKKMSGDFFDQLNIPLPDVNLNCGGGSHAEQTAAIMISFEKYLIKNPTDLVLVVGDVTSTMACAITAKKQRLKVAHVEGGIRSNDWSMPEEINRLITDSISDYFFTTSKSANQNLIKSGVENDRIYFVGNTMIDTLIKNQRNFIKPDLWQDLNLKKGNYIMITLHRPSNVDNKSKLKDLINEIIYGSKNLPVIFPVHPRTNKIIHDSKISYPNLKLVSPMSYLEFNYLVKNSFAMITDSGGITEETTIMGIPCLTIRDNTERPETVFIGTNELVGSNPKNLRKYMKKLFNGGWKKGSVPELWDGNTSKRIIDIIISI